MAGGILENRKVDNTSVSKQKNYFHTIKLQEHGKQSYVPVNLTQIGNQNLRIV